MQEVLSVCLEFGFFTTEYEFCTRIARTLPFPHRIAMLVHFSLQIRL